jgi:mono/diheme cytochrome c family protein
MNAKWVFVSVAAWLAFAQPKTTVSLLAAQQPAVQSAAAAGGAAAQRALIDKYCVGCHNEKTKSGNFRLDTADVNAVGQHADVWEKVVRKLRGGVMPPPGMPRPDKVTYDGFATWIETELDRTASATPNPGRTQSLHRLNRTEYRAIVRDLLGLDMDFSDLLPIDDSGGGEASFDNIASSLRLTQTLMEQYLSVALKVSRGAVGSPPPVAELTFKKSAGLRQDIHLDGMPFGTRGGILLDYIFPVDAEYEFKVNVAGGGRGQIDFAMDGERVKLFEYEPPRRQAGYDPDAAGMAAGPGAGLTLRMPVKAGPKTITVAFVKSAALVQLEGDREPFEGGRGQGAGIDSLVINGPFNVSGKGDTPSRQKIFTCRPTSAANEEACAKNILTSLARRAYRRPLTDHDTTVLMTLYKDGRAESDFEGGVERGLRGILVNPNFLFRVEKDPANAEAGKPYRISDLELASRLSFFLWSSVPDDQLLDLAIKRRLHDPVVLKQQVKRMLADDRAETLTTSFASQWLWMRNIKAASPSETIFPNFDEGLKEAFKTELEMFFSSVVKEDRSAIDLLDGNYTFVNERLAKHYGIPNIYGMDFRRVTLAADSPRRGLLGKGLLLLVTSRSTRTSPVVRGRWILENLLGTPPPAPPPNIPPLPEQKQADGRVLTVRELMARHRSNATCASCHSTIDPAGFALEQFDAVGKWRTVDAGFQPIDASGNLPDGTKFSGINDFRGLLLANRAQFVKTMTNKMMMYALGRGTEYYDAPAIRKIVKDAAASNFKFSELVMGIVNSTPFQMRTATGAVAEGQVAAHAKK